MKTRILICLVSIACLVGCTSKESSYTSTDISVATDTAYKEKVVKTAHIRFRVHNVLAVKARIGDEVGKYGGTVTASGIQSIVQNSEQVKYTADSLKEIVSYTMEGTIVAKLPSEKLDDFTNLIGKIALFVDNQGIKMDDQSIQYLQNKLKAQARRDALNQVGSKEKVKGDLQNSVALNDDLIDQKLQNRIIDDNVRFSTITMVFYQDNEVKQFIVGNDNLSEYRPSFFRRLGLNIAEGWAVFMELILWLSRLWMLFLVVGIAYFLIRKYTNRKRTTIFKEPPPTI